MHGDVAYCRKNGHDYKIKEIWNDCTGIEWWHRECQICGKNEVIGVWFREEEEEKEEKE